MSYTFSISTGLITRDTDGVVVAPQMQGDMPSGPFPAETDPVCLEFRAWLAEGNLPTGTPTQDTV